MILHPPFFISGRLLPALRIGDAVLHLSDMQHAMGREGRDVAEFILDLPDGTEYRDSNLQSGRQGFRGAVEMFETFLSFMGACGESVRYADRSGEPGENADLFPPHVAAWCAENCDEISVMQCELTDPETGGYVRHELIEE